MKRLAVLVSGGGTNMQAIIDSCKSGILKGLAQSVVVISNNPNAFALKRAEKENIKSVCIERKNYADELSFNAAILKELRSAQTDIVCLAGYMRMLGKEITDAYPKRVLNIHPALLPKFGGKGMFGRYVHEAVAAAKEKKSGATVHFVDEHYDNGEIIIQREIPVFKKDLPADIAARVLKAEHQIYPQAIRKAIKSENIKGYIIHVKGDAVREKHIREQIKNIDIFFEFILDGQPEDLTKEIVEKTFSGGMKNILNSGGETDYFNLGTASCTYKHLLAYRDVVKSNIPFGIVFENDIVAEKNFNEMIFKVLDEIKSRGLKNFIISLEDSMLRYVARSKRVNGRLIYRNPNLTRFAGAYLFDLEYAKNMLDYVDKKGCNDVIDWFINHRDREKIIDIYWLHPTIATGGTSCGKLSSYFECRRNMGFKRFFRRVSFTVQRAYKKLLWNLR
ncbi:MAG: phosphoribosylglycinamide formyltransferase [Endomicrobium sp.]|jgi:formyltetrahydrofolate-dependent phosphoribosylglycinamide formyltransferase|nr:phosphoribosylglycinamide formyltransferase [Endomicrobium sp.]